MDGRRIRIVLSVLILT